MVRVQYQIEKNDFKIIQEYVAANYPACQNADEFEKLASEKCIDFTFDELNLLNSDDTKDSLRQILSDFWQKQYVINRNDTLVRVAEFSTRKFTATLNLTRRIFPETLSWTEQVKYNFLAFLGALYAKKLKGGEKGRG